MAGEFGKLVSEVLASPLGDVIASVGEGVAAAQRALDEASLATTLEIYSEGGEPLLQLMREIGYRPTFYALPETVAEVNVSLQLSADGGGGPRGSTAASVSPERPLARIAPSASRVRTYVTPVDAGFANRYNFTAAASAKLTFKIVPVPVPAGAEDVRRLPDLSGRTVAAARDALDALDLPPRFVDAQGRSRDPAASDIVTGTSPAANAVMRAGDEVTVTV